MKKEQLSSYVQSIFRHPNRFAKAFLSEVVRYPFPIKFSMTGETQKVEGLLPDSISRYMYLLEGIRDYEPETTFMIRNIVEPGNTVLIIGAHIGLHAILAKQIVGEEGLVVGFEPTPNIFEVFKRNCAGRNIITEQLAITHGDEQVEMTLFDVRHSSWNTGSTVRSKKIGTWSPSKVMVPATSIDRYCIKNNVVPNVLVIDIENGEMDALRGGEQTIRSCLPRIIIECGDLGRGEENSTNACLSLLSSWGYKIIEVDRKTGFLKPHIILPGYPNDYPNVLAVHTSDNIKSLLGI